MKVIRKTSQNGIRKEQERNKDHQLRRDLIVQKE